MAGTQGRVYGGDCNLVHIPDGTRKDIGAAIADLTDMTIRVAADENNPDKNICPGCAMIALFNAAIHMADANGQSRTELGRTMSRAFAKLAANPEVGLTEEIEVILDPE